MIYRDINKHVILFSDTHVAWNAAQLPKLLETLCKFCLFVCLFLFCLPHWLSMSHKSFSKDECRSCPTVSWLVVVKMFVDQYTSIFHRLHWNTSYTWSTLSLDMYVYTCAQTCMRTCVLVLQQYLITVNSTSSFSNCVCVSDTSVSLWICVNPNDN